MSEAGTDRARAQWAAQFPGYPAGRGRGSLLPVVLVWMLFAIMVIPGGFDYSGSTDLPTEGDALSRTTWLLLLCGGGLLVLQRFAPVRAVLKRTNRPFLFFVLLASLSLIWSIEPGYTARRLFRLYIIVGVCLAFVTVGWEPGSFQKHLRRVVSVVLAASAVFCYVNPQLAIHHNEGAAELMNAWHGITTGKNVLGSVAGCGLILWLHALLTREAGRLVSLANMAVAVLCLVMSRSSTSLMAAAFATLLTLLLLRSPGSMRRYLPYIVGIFAALVLVYALAVLNVIPGLEVVLKPIAMITGKDQTFTGRTNIWYVLRLHMAQHPLLGTGYGAYWIGPVPSSPSYLMVQMLYFYPTEGHNGYLDVMNDLGYIGGACLLAYFIVYLRQAVSLLKIDRNRGALYLILVFRAFLADMSESHWFSVLSIDFVVFTLATFSLARELMHARSMGGWLAAQVGRWRAAGAQAAPAAGVPAAGLR